MIRPIYVRIEAVSGTLGQGKARKRLTRFLSNSRDNTRGIAVKVYSRLLALACCSVQRSHHKVLMKMKVVSWRPRKDEVLNGDEVSVVIIVV